MHPVRAMQLEQGARSESCMLTNGSNRVHCNNNPTACVMRGELQVPPELEQALMDGSGIIQGGQGRQLTSSSRRLMAELRKNSRTAARSGDNAAVDMDAASGLRLRRSRKVIVLPTISQSHSH